MRRLWSSSASQLLMRTYFTVLWMSDVHIFVCRLHALGMAKICSSFSLEFLFPTARFPWSSASPIQSFVAKGKNCSKSEIEYDLTILIDLYHILVVPNAQCTHRHTHIRNSSNCKQSSKWHRVAVVCSEAHMQILSVHCGTYFLLCRHIFLSPLHPEFRSDDSENSGEEEKKWRCKRTTTEHQKNGNTDSALRNSINNINTKCRQSSPLVSFHFVSCTTKLSRICILHVMTLIINYNNDQRREKDLKRSLAKSTAYTHTHTRTRPRHSINNEQHHRFNHSLFPFQIEKDLIN